MFPEYPKQGVKHLCVVLWNDYMQVLWVFRGSPDQLSCSAMFQMNNRIGGAANCRLGFRDSVQMPPTWRRILILHTDLDGYVNLLKPLYCIGLSVHSWALNGQQILFMWGSRNGLGEQIVFKMTVREVWLLPIGVSMNHLVQQPVIEVCHFPTHRQ